jgi:methyl-accepting chemotaxis protein
MTIYDLISKILIEGFWAYLISIAALLILWAVLKYLVSPQIKEYFESMKDMVNRVNNMEKRNVVVDEKILHIVEAAQETKSILHECMTAAKQQVTEIMEKNQEAFKQLEETVEGLQRMNEKTTEMVIDLDKRFSAIATEHSVYHKHK